MIAALLLAAAAAAPAAAPADAEEERARAYFTDTVLITQAGNTVRFYSDLLARRVVVVNFMFTRCESACPLMTARLAALRRELGERFGREVVFVSISVDPRDTPEDLAAFARTHGAAAAGWTFLTGRREDVELVTRRLGQWVDAPEDHGTLLLAGNTRTRRWAKLRSDTPTVGLAAQVREIADAPGR